MASLTTRFSYELISVLGRMMDHLIVSVIKHMYMWKYDLTNQCLPLFGSGTLSWDMLAAYTCVLVTGNRLLVDTGSFFCFLFFCLCNMDLPNYEIKSRPKQETILSFFRSLTEDDKKNVSSHLSLLCVCMCVSALQSETDQCTELSDDAFKFCFCFF